MKIKAGIIGYGRNGSTMHAGSMEKLPDLFQVVAVCDLEVEKRNKARDRFRCNVYEDYHEMFRCEKLDFVVVVTRNIQHSVMVVDCLNAGINTLVTKPWATSVADAELIMDAWKKSGVKLLPWLPTRRGTEYAFLRKLVDSGVIGPVHYIDHTVRSFSTRADWQTDKASGGGYLFNWGPHIIDTAIMLSGRKAASVFAKMHQVINPGDVEDDWTARIITQGGTVVDASYRITPGSGPDWTVCGSKGTIEVRGAEITVTTNVPAVPAITDQYSSKPKNSNHIETYRQEPYYPWGDELTIYRDEIAPELNGHCGAYATTPSDAFELSRVFDAIRISSNTGRSVELAPQDRQPYF